MKIKIAPSILSADFSRLGDEIKKIELAGADMIHVDVMDGHFVPNITIGPVVIKDIRKVTKLPLDVHLMVEKPEKFIDAFVNAGADMITIHIEAISKLNVKSPRHKDWRVRLRREKEKLMAKNVKLGISLNPRTPLSRIKDLLPIIDFVLVMTVNPGFSGQGFMEEAVPKIKELRRLFNGDIAVDGGINEQTAKLVIAAGANILAAGSYVFGARNTRLAIERIRNAR